MGDMAYYDEAAVGADILAFDIYPIAAAMATHTGNPADWRHQLVDPAQFGGRTGG